MNNQSSVMELDEQLSAYFDGELGDGGIGPVGLAAAEQATGDQAAGDQADLADVNLGATLRALVDGDLEGDEELAAKLADLAFMRTMIVGALEHQADRVPEARFEQVWDGFEQALERESRLQEAAEAPPSLWQRLSAWARPVRLPLAVVGAAGALVFVFARSAGAPTETEGDANTVAANSGDSNTQVEDASDAPATPEARREPQPSPASQPIEPAPRVAIALDQPDQPDQPSPEIDSDVMMFPQPEPGEAEIRRIEFGGRTGTISQVEGSRGTTTVIWVTEDDGPADSERSL